MTEVYWVPGSWHGKLGILVRPRGGDWLEDEVRHWRRLGIDVMVSLLTPDESTEFDLTNEVDVCRSAGIEYVSLPIPDRGVPSSQEEILKLVSKLDGRLMEGKKVGIHCRQGIGRSAVIAACLLVSRGLSSDAAFERLTQARGCSVPETKEQREWVENFAPELVEAGAKQNPDRGNR